MYNTSSAVSLAALSAMTLGLTIAGFAPTASADEVNDITLVSASGHHGHYGAAPHTGGPGSQSNATSNPTGEGSLLGDDSAAGIPVYNKHGKIIGYRAEDNNN